MEVASKQSKRMIQSTGREKNSAPETKRPFPL